MSPKSKSEQRFKAATAAMAGLLADHKDHENERRTHTVQCGVYADGSPSMKTVYEETCAQAVARLAVEHADALIAELNKPTK